MTINIMIKIGEIEKPLELPEGSDSFTALKSLGLHPDAVLVFRNGKVSPEDEGVSEGDVLEIVRIASGG